MKPCLYNKGFTLIELITVVVLIGILSALGGFLIFSPIQSFVDQSRRAELTDIADNALQRISRELRQALPNSVRIAAVAGGGSALEFLNTTTGGRYRARLETDGSGEQLGDTDSPGVDTFDVLGGVAGTVNPGPAGIANCRNGNSDCLVLYNTGTDFSAYTGNNAAAITAVSATQISYDNTAGFPFPIPPSAQQRFFVVDTPVSYVCDLAAGQLLRYDNYTITASPQPTTPAGFGVAAALLANNVSSCGFSYNSGAGTRHGLVTLRITVSRDGENVALLYQTHVLNIP